MKNKFLELIVFFNKFLDNKFKINLVLIILASVINGFIEILGFAALIPFLSILNNDKIYSNNHFIEIQNFFEIGSAENLVYLLILGALLFFFLSIFISYLINFFIFRFSYSFNLEFGKKLVFSYLKSDISLIDQNTSSQIINKITHETSKLCEMLGNLIQLLSKLIFLIVIIAFLSTYNLKLFLILSGIVLFYFLIFKFLKKYILNFADQLSLSQNKIINLSSNIIEAFKEIQSLGIKHKIYKEYSIYKKKYEKIFFLNTLFTTFPKVLLELIIILLIFTFTLIMYFKHDLSTFKEYFFEISFIFILIVRLNPVANILYTNFHAINKFSNVIKIFSKDLINKINLNKTEILKKNKSLNSRIAQIVIKKLDFSYKNSTKILSNINLTLKRGEFYGIIGESGSGKSTLANIIANYIKSPSISSKINYYDIERKKISEDNLIDKTLLLSQKTFLFNTSLKENITLKEKTTINEDHKFLKVLKIVDLDKFSNKQNKKFKGEIYYNFSGGEIQRISIARALYQKKEIIIFDESLSNLNHSKQIKIIKEIKKLKTNKIIVMITHDIHLMKYFDKVFKISKGKLLKN